MTQQNKMSVDFPNSSFFVGRETFLQKLRSLLFHNRKVIITGMSGVGKTSVAREYVQRFSSEYQFVCWLNMATDETLLADLVTSLQTLSLPITMAQGISGLFQALQAHLVTRHDFLLVLDNPPDVFSFQALQGQQPMGGQLLVITRVFKSSPDVSSQKLGGLEAQEGALLLLRQAGSLTEYATLDRIDEETRSAALELARELHGLPIALKLAGGYLRETGCGIRDYLFSFRDCSTRLHLSASSAAEDLQEVAVACELSLTNLLQEKRTAFELLQLGALLLPETALPGSLFEQAKEPIALPASESEKSASWIESIRSLRAFGLVTSDKEGFLLNMHPLIQELVCQFSEPKELQQQGIRALHMFQPILAALNTEPLPPRLLAAGHIRHLAQLGEQWPLFFNAAAEVFCWAASLLWEQGLVATAEPLLRRAYIIWERTPGTSPPGVATILGNLAMLNSLLKNYAEAEDLSQRAVVSKTDALGINHPDVLIAIDELGKVYTAQGKQLEARLCYEKALSIGDEVGLRHHPAYSVCMYDLALLYIEQKQFDQAEPLLRKVCFARDQVLDSRDPATMLARFSLAEVSVKLKNWERADVCYRQALPTCEQVLGAEHPVTLGHLERAAIVFLHLGNSAEAKLNWQRVLEVRERTSGVQHPELIVCLSGLAQIALAQEQFPEALALLERAQYIYASQSEPERQVLSAMLDTLASVETADQADPRIADIVQKLQKLTETPKLRE